MRWQGGRRSGNVQDRRGRGPALAGGGIGAILITLVAVMLGVDPSAIVTGGGGPAENVPTAEPGAFTGVDEEADFVAAVLGDTEVTWHEIFNRRGMEYREPQLVLFEDAGPRTAAGAPRGTSRSGSTNRSARANRRAPASAGRRGG
jgi:uncharacterized protein